MLVNPIENIIRRKLDIFDKEPVTSPWKHINKYSHEGCKPYSVTANKIVDGQGQKNPEYSDRSCCWNRNSSIDSSITQVVRVQG